jgi:hypothetical protein
MSGMASNTVRILAHLILRNDLFRLASPERGGNPMNDTTNLDQADEDTYTISDEALEAAAGTTRAAFPFSLPPCYPRFLLTGGVGKQDVSTP